MPLIGCGKKNPYAFGFFAKCFDSPIACNKLHWDTDLGVVSTASLLESMLHG